MGQAAILCERFYTTVGTGATNKEVVPLSGKVNGLIKGSSRATFSRRQFIVRALSAGVLAGSGGSLLAACGGDQQGSASGKVKFLAAEVPTAFQPAIKAFEKSHPDISIAYNNYPFDQLNSILQSRLQSKDSSFSCYAVDQPRVPGFAARGYLTDLSDEASTVKKKVLSSAFEASSYDGKLYSLPIWTSTQVLYYNTSLLDKAGVEPPSIDPHKRWTWDETLSAAKETQNAGAKWGLVFNQINRYYQLQPLPESLGGGPGLTGPDLLEPDVTNDAWVRAFEWYRSLFSDGLSPRGVPPEQTAALFAGGEVAMFVGLPSDPTLEEAKSKGQLDWEVGAHPYFGGGKPVTPTDSWSWGLNPFSDQQEAAREWLEYVALDKKGALLGAQNVPVPPTQVDAYREWIREVSERPTEPKGWDELIRYELSNTAVHRPRSIGYVQFEEVMNTAFEDIANGADVRATLQRASSELDEALEPLRRALEQQEG
jgi:multiple sugar transport system substrate-binding protein